VIILLGVFTVIQIFPIGFGQLRATGNRSFANRLAQQEIERVRSESANLPQGVLFSLFDANGVSFVKNEDPDDLSSYNPNGGNVNNPYFTDVNKFRYIKGEPIKVPLPTTSAYGSGSVYTLKYGPVYMDKAVGDPNSVPTTSTIGVFNAYLRVSGGPMTGYPADSDGGTNGNAVRFLRTPSSYAIDYGDDGGTAYILFPRSGRDRTFTITYTYSTEDASEVATGGSTVTAEIVVPPNALQWYAVPGLPSGASMDPRSETVQRNFERLPATGAWDTGDPYQYKLISANITQAAAGTPSFANLGVVAFNPSGATYTESTPYGQQAFTAYADYAVLDWHILRDDREVPSVFADSTGAVPVRTTVPNIKRQGNEEFDGKTIYPGLFRDTDNPADIAVFDLQNGHLNAGGTYTPGEALTPGDYDKRLNAPDKDADYWINYNGRQGTYPSGTIYINTNRVRPGSQLRILYKAEGDWAVSVQKAFSAYRVTLNAATNAPDTRPGGFDAYGQEATRLHFGLGDLNKSFSAIFEYYKTDGSLARTGPHQFTADRTTDDGVDMSGARLRYATADIRNFLPGLDTMTARPGTAYPAGWRVVGEVQGVSLKTRVIYRDNDSYKNSWRIQDLDTYITRSPATAQ